MEWNPLCIWKQNVTMRVGAKKCLGSGPLCRPWCALMQQISSAEALLIFKPWKYKTREVSHRDIHGCLAWLSALLPCLSLFPGNVCKPMLSQLSDSPWLTQRLSFIDKILDWKDRPWIQSWEESIFLLYPLNPRQWSTNQIKFTLTSPGSVWWFNSHSKAFLVESHQSRRKGNKLTKEQKSPANLSREP